MNDGMILSTPDERRAEPIRAGFGRGLAKAGEQDPRVVALCADLTESTQMHLFRDRHPDRFIQVGVAEQNLVTVASGLAHAALHPLHQQLCSIQPWTKLGANQDHSVLERSPGQGDRITRRPQRRPRRRDPPQTLEDIALMRTLPNMVVIAPADSVEAEAATLAIAKDPRPTYLRLARDATEAVIDDAAVTVIGQATELRASVDVGIIATGTMTREALDAAEVLITREIDAGVLHVPTIKPLDDAAVVELAEATELIVTIEEAQRTGGLGSAVTELLSERRPTPVLRLGVDDRFGESGPPRAVLEAFGLTAASLVDPLVRFVDAH